MPGAIVADIGYFIFGEKTNSITQSAVTPVVSPKAGCRKFAKTLDGNRISAANAATGKPTQASPGSASS